MNTPYIDERWRASKADSLGRYGSTLESTFHNLAARTRTTTRKSSLTSMTRRLWTAIPSLRIQILSHVDAEHSQKPLKEPPCYSGFCTRAADAWTARCDKHVSNNARMTTTYSEAHAAASAALAASNGHLLSIVEARQMMSDLRRTWSNLESGVSPPFGFSHRPLDKPYTIEQFALAFVLFHHSRRLAKGHASQRDAQANAAQMQ